MSTEHVFQIGISIDDEAIMKATLEKAANDISKGITECLFKGGYYRNEPTETTKEIIEKEAEKILKKNEDFIINTAIEKIVSKVYNSKKFKAFMEKIYEEGQNED